MLNVEDMMDLVNGDLPEVKSIWCMDGDRIKCIDNIQCYRRLKIHINKGQEPIFFVVSKDLGEVFCGSKVFDNVDEFLESVNDMFKGVS